MRREASAAGCGVRAAPDTSLCCLGSAPAAPPLSFFRPACRQCPVRRASACRNGSYQCCAPLLLPLGLDLRLQFRHAARLLPRPARCTPRRHSHPRLLSLSLSFSLSLLLSRSCSNALLPRPGRRWHLESVCLSVTPRAVDSYVLRHQPLSPSPPPDSAGLSLPHLPRFSTGGARGSDLALSLVATFSPPSTLSVITRFLSPSFPICEENFESQPPSFVLVPRLGQDPFSARECVALFLEAGRVDSTLSMRAAWTGTGNETRSSRFDSSLVFRLQDKQPRTRTD